MKWATDLVVAVVALWFVSMPGFAQGSTNEEKAGLDIGGELALQSFDGPVTLSQLNGKIVLLFFGFTSCADVCPLTLSTLSRAFSRLTAEELDQVAALFISVDPERDTPELLKKYTGYFHANIIGATADHQALDRFAAHYGVTYERKKAPDSAHGYAISHTPDILIVDRQGRLLEARIGFPATIDDIENKIKDVLSSQAGSQ